MPRWRTTDWVSAEGHPAWVPAVRRSRTKVLRNCFHREPTIRVIEEEAFFFELQGLLRMFQRHHELLDVLLPTFPGNWGRVWQRISSRSSRASMLVRQGKRNPSVSLSQFIAVEQFLTSSIVWLSHYSLVLVRLKDSLLERGYQELEVNFRNYWRSIITIATSIHRSRELRNFFLDLTEKLIEPWKMNNWSENQVKDFLGAITKCVLDLQSFGQTSGSEVRCLWDRYMNVLNVCLLRMYHNWRLLASSCDDLNKKGFALNPRNVLSMSLSK